MFDFETVSTISFLIILIALAIIDRKNIEFKYGVIIRRTKRGKEWIYNIGRKYKKPLKILGTVGIFIAFLASIASFYFLLQSSYQILTKPEEAMPGVKFIIPQVPSKIVCAHALCVPFWYWIIGVLSVLFSHEILHGLVSRAEGIKIKSFGLLSLLILPGAFVEPDEKQLKKSKSLIKLRIFAVGSFGNLIVVLITTLIIFGSIALLNAVFEASGVKFNSTIPGTPAYEANLSGAIIEMNDKPIRNFTEFANIMEKIKPGDEVKIKTTEGTFVLKTIENPENKSQAFIGVRNVSTRIVYIGLLKGLGEPSPIFISSIEWILNLFLWVNFLNLGVGLINLLPIKPLDGGLMFEELFRSTFKGKSVYLINALSLFTLMLLVINLIGPSITSYIASVFLISKFLTG